VLKQFVHTETALVERINEYWKMQINFN